MTKRPPFEVVDRAERQAALAEVVAKMITSARHAGVSFGFVRIVEKRAPFIEQIPKVKLPAVWLIADVGNANDSFGSAGFDAQSLAVLRGTLRAVVINSAAVGSEYYAVAMTAALIGALSITALAETHERYFADRHDYFKVAKIPILNVISPPDGHA